MHLLVCVLPNCCAIQTSSLLASSAMSERHWAHHWGVCAQSINQSVRRWYMTTSITKAKIISAIRRIANININNVNVNCDLRVRSYYKTHVWDQQTASLTLRRPLLSHGHNHKASCVPDRIKLSFVIFDIRAHDAQPWASECPDVKNHKWRLNSVRHRMLYSCTYSVSQKKSPPKGSWHFSFFSQTVENF